MIETRATPRKLPLSERVSRAASLEGMLAAGLIVLWALLGMVSLPVIWVWVILLFAGLLLLLAALISGSGVAQVFIGLCFFGTTTLIAAAAFAQASLNIGLVASSGSTLLLFELFRLHNTRRRNAAVSPTLLPSVLPWTVAVVLVSVVIVVVLVPSEGQKDLPWGFVPAATVALMLAVGGIGFGAARSKTARSGRRFDPIIRIPPAPRQVDPLVDQARKAAIQPGDNAMPPPPAGKPIESG